MTFDEFKKSLIEKKPPVFGNQLLLAMWYDGKKEWKQAHDIIQDIEDSHASLIHAYLHRKEGDQFNAGYWYGKAGRKMPEIPLNQEWNEIVEELLRIEF